MKVILTEKVKSLGNVGEIVNVSAGYARNYILPNGFGVVADESNKKQLENHKRSLAKKMAEEKTQAEATAKKLNGVELSFVKKAGASGKLFGSITTNDLSIELAKQGIEVERRLITLENPIKAIGNFTAKAKLYSGVDAEFTVKVTLDPKQAEELKARAAAAKEMKAKKEAEAAKAEAAEGEEKTEEQKLQEEANEITK